MPKDTQTSNDLPRLTASPPNALFWGLTIPGTVVAPSEVPPPVSVASDRFVKRVERIDSTKRDSDGLSRVSQQALDLLERLHPDVDRDDLIELALLLEASAADTKAFLRSVTDPGRLPTDHGDLVVLDYLVLTPMLSRDPDNPRSILRLGTGGPATSYTYTSPILDEYDAESLRTLEFRDTAHYEELHQAQRAALGFEGQVRDHRDRLDLERGARLGILKPATVAPVRLVDRSTGNIGLQLGLVDANRRYTLIERLADAVMPGLGFGRFSRRHFFDGNGLVFRRFTAQDAHDAREALADAFANIDAPGGTGDETVDARELARWAREIDDNHPDRAVMIRTRVMRCRVIVGLDPASALAPENPMTVAIGAYRDQLHLPDLADVEWTARATEAMVGQDLLRRSRNLPCVAQLRAVGQPTPEWQDVVLFDPADVPWHVPGIRSTHVPDVAAEAAGVDVADVVTYDDGVAALSTVVPAALPGDAVVPRPRNVLDLALATAATVVCRDQPMATVISEVLAHHRMPNSPKARGQIAAALLLPLLNLPAEGPDTATAYAALSRSVSHGVIYKLDEARDPLGANVRWIDLIGADWFDVVERARKEAASGNAVTAHGERTFGPAQTLLALAATICLEVSPAVITSDSGRNVYQLTLSGLGGQRGRSKAEPFALLLQLVTHDEGIDQLWEAIVAAIAGRTARPARSIRWDPDLAAEYDRMYGPYLTEVDLRDRTWGHGAGTTGAGGGSAPTVRSGAADFVAAVFARVAADLEGHALEVASIAELGNMDTVDPELDAEADDYAACPTRAFYRDGVDTDVAERILAYVATLQQATIQGKIARTARSHGSVA